MDKTDSINASVEYIEMLVFFLLICFAYSRNKYMDKYDQWMAEREARMRQFTAKNNLEITADFILGRLEKLYIVLLYVVALRAMNIVHTLILGFMTVFLLRQRFARKKLRRHHFPPLLPCRRPKHRPSRLPIRLPLPVPTDPRLLHNRH